MEKLGNIEIKIVGKVGAEQLLPEKVKSKFDKDYLNALISNARGNWKNIDVDDWLNNIRGDYEI